MKKLFILILFIASNISLAQSEQSIFNQDKKIVLRYFKTETLGGKLDFELKMKNDKRAFYLYDRIMYNRKDFAIFLWGQAIKKTNKFSKKEASKLWEEIKQRDLSKPERKALYKGFSIELKDN